MRQKPRAEERTEVLAMTKEDQEEWGVRWSDMQHFSHYLRISMGGGTEVAPDWIAKTSVLERLIKMGIDLGDDCSIQAHA